MAGGFSRPSHQMSPSSVRATLVKTELPWLIVRIALGLVCSLVPGRDAEEPELGVDRVEPAVGADPHPGDVVAERLDLPARDRRGEHREVGLAAGAGERGGDVLHHALGAGELEDEHVLGHPALVAGHHAGDAEGVALLAEQRVAAVAGAEAPDRALLGEVDDVLGLAAGPLDVLLARLERHADRVEGGDVVGVDLLHLAEDLGAHAGHHAHAGDDVGGVGDLDAEHRPLGVEVAHDEGDDVHGPAPHAAPVEVGHDRPSSRRAPSSCWWGRRPSCRASRCRCGPRRAPRRWGRRPRRTSWASCSGPPTGIPGLRRPKRRAGAGPAVRSALGGAWLHTQRRGAQES